MALSKLMRTVRSNVITGTLMLLPLFTTIYVFVVLFRFVDQALPKAFHAMLPSIMPERWLPGVGLALTIFVAYFAGLAAKNFIGRWFIDTGNSVIARIPILNKIYLGIQQIVDAMSSANKRLFERPVLVKFPRDNSYCIGFVTAQTTGEVLERVGRPTVSVFVPTTPNPTSGFLLYLPEDELIDLNMNVETAVKLVMSAGMVNADQLRRTQHLYTLPKSLKGWNWLRSLRGRGKTPPDDSAGNPDTP
jgi:uncharacterized membrane protein